ncbi:MAG: nucleotide pyrophosphatase, partial [Candidatus Binatia bacterium]
PTLLAMLGLARGADMDGRVMTTLLDAEFLAAHPLREVPTHTPEDWSATRRLAEVADPGSHQRLEQLRGLGYLE